MTKYKLYRHNVWIDKKWWIFPLAVQIHTNNPWYTEKNFEIIVDFLCIHVRWIFTKTESEVEE